MLRHQLQRGFCILTSAGSGSDRCSYARPDRGSRAQGQLSNEFCEGDLHGSRQYRALRGAYRRCKLSCILACGRRGQITREGSWQRSIQLSAERFELSSESGELIVEVPKVFRCPLGLSGKDKADILPRL